MLPANGVSISWTRFEHGNARGSLGPCSRRQQCSAPALLDRPAQQSAELSAQTFCTFPREFSSATRQRLEGRGPDPEPVLMIYSCYVRFPLLSGLRRRMYTPVAVRSERRSGTSIVRRPRRPMGISRMMPIGWHQGDSGARRPRVTSGLRARPRPCRSTFHRVSGRETPNAAAHDCAGRRRTRPGDAPS